MINLATSKNMDLKSKLQMVMFHGYMMVNTVIRKNDLMEKLHVIFHIIS